MNNHAKTTLYVRGIAEETTSEQFQEFFSEVGPVKSAFFIQSKQADSEISKSKCGFVHYALAEDATAALESLKKKRLGGKQLKIEFAKHRQRNIAADTQERKSEKFDEDEGFEPVAIEQSVEIERKAVNVLKIKQLKQLAKIVIVSGASLAKIDRKQLHKKVRKFGNVIDIQFPSNIQLNPPMNGVISSEKLPQAQITYKCVLEAQKAASKLDNHIFKGDKVSACVHPSIAECKKNSRVVVRNLKFTTTIEDLCGAFAQYGPILEISLPQNANDTSKNRGFAFVSFARKEDAEKALEAINGNVLPSFGRLVVVDFVKPKNEYENAVEASKAVEESLENEPSDSKATESDLEMSADEDDDEDEVASVLSGSEDGIDVTLTGEAEEDSNEPAKKLNMMDADDGCTLFIRNLSFETDDDALADKFSEFGKVIYARVVFDHNSGRPKGTGFVKMASKEDADKIIAMQPAADTQMDISGDLPPESSTMIYLRGRPLFVLRAKPKVSMTDNDETTKGSSKTSISQPSERDKRNIYLLKEILFQPTSAVLPTLSKKFLDDLQELYRARVKKLQKQMHLCVSRTRLSVRHLGKSADEKAIKKIAFDAVKAFQKELKTHTAANPQSAKIQKEFAIWKAEKLFDKIVVKHVKIIKDKISGKSLGYGFIEFSNHAHALACLRQIKNTLKVEGISDSRRWVLEFSIENSVILKKRSDREVAAKEKLVSANQKQQQSTKSKIALKKKLQQKPAKKKIAIETKKHK